MEQSEGKSKRRRWWKWAALLALLVLLVAAYFGWRLHQRRLVERELAWYRAQGYPTTLEELAAWYPHPKGANAADAYLDAFEAYSDETKEEANALPVVGEGRRPPLGEPLTDKVAKLARAYLDRNGQAIVHLQRAVTIPGCRFPVRLALGPNVPLEHLVKLRQAARLCELEALLLASEGKPQEVFETLTAGLELGRSLKTEPIFISRLVAIAMDAIAIHALQETINLVPLTDAELRELDRLLAAAEEDSSVTRGLVGEAAMHNDFMRTASGKEIASMWGGSGAVGLARVSLWRVLWGEADRAFYLRGMRRRIEHARRHAAASGKAPRAPRMTHTIPKTYVMSLILLPALERASLYASQKRARCRAPRVALAVERYRLKQNRLPPSLKDLVPAYLKALPLDPFTGKPLIYRKLKQGFVVYSVGENGKDEGGLPRKRRPGSDDISFRILRVAPRKGKAP